MFTGFAARAQISAVVTVHTQVDEAGVAGAHSGPVNHAAVAAVASGGSGNVVGRFTGFCQGGAVTSGARGRGLDLGVIEGARRRPFQG